MYLDKLLKQVYCELLVGIARLIKYIVGVTHILLGAQKRPRSFDPALRIYRIEKAAAFNRPVDVTATAFCLCTCYSSIYRFSRLKTKQNKKTGLPGEFWCSTIEIALSN